MSLLVVSCALEDEAEEEVKTPVSLPDVLAPVEGLVKSVLLLDTLAPVEVVVEEIEAEAEVVVVS